MGRIIIAAVAAVAASPMDSIAKAPLSLSRTISSRLKAPASWAVSRPVTRSRSSLSSAARQASLNVGCE